MQPNSQKLKAKLLTTGSLSTSKITNLSDMNHFYTTNCNLVM